MSAGAARAAAAGQTAAAGQAAGAGTGWSLAVRQFRFWLTDYRRTWRGSIYTGLANPLLFLGAIGLGLGTLVNARGTGRLGGVSAAQSTTNSSGVATFTLPSA